MELTIDFLKQIGFIYEVIKGFEDDRPTSLTNGVIRIYDTEIPFRATFRNETYYLHTVEQLTCLRYWDVQIKNGIDWRKDESLKLEKENIELKKVLLSCVEIYRQYANDDPAENEIFDYAKSLLKR